MSGPIVETTQGRLSGKRCLDYDGNNYFSFQGIPYAKPPVGELRFKPPEPPYNWAEVRNATYHGSESISRHLYFHHTVGAEDCLYLNVYTPRLPCCKCQGCKLPVMMYIHGGKYLSGSANDDILGPDFIMTQMVVLVTINYRLGLLGFLSLDDPNLGVGNAGLKDTVQALKWIRANIHSFNGDRTNVTIFGCSAGALSVHCLMLSPLAKGLFHKAIIQSGSALSPWSFAKESSVEAANASDYVGALSNKADILNHLKKIPENKILEIQERIEDNLLPCQKRLYGAVIEPKSKNAFLVESPMQSITSGNYNKVPLIIGYANMEGSLIEPLLHCKRSPIKCPIDFEDMIPGYYNIERDSDLSKDVARMIQHYYYGNVDASIENNKHLYTMNTDIMFLRGIYLTIKNQLSGGAPIYFYRFSVDDSLNINKKMLNVKCPGACHADVVGYLFKNSQTPILQKGGVAETTMYRMVKLWTTFASNGDPNPETADPLIDVIWEPVKYGCIKSLEIGEKLSFEPNSDLDRMEFWDKITEYIAQNRKSIPTDSLEEMEEVGSSIQQSIMSGEEIDPGEKIASPDIESEKKIEVEEEKDPDELIDIKEGIEGEPDIIIPVE